MSILLVKYIFKFYKINVNLPSICAAQCSFGGTIQDSHAKPMLATHCFIKEEHTHDLKS